jgi:hypothetical protein
VLRKILYYTSAMLAFHWASKGVIDKTKHAEYHNRWPVGAVNGDFKGIDKVCAFPVVLIIIIFIPEQSANDDADATQYSHSHICILPSC